MLQKKSLVENARLELAPDAFSDRGRPIPTLSLNRTLLQFFNSIPLKYSTLMMAIAEIAALALITNSISGALVDCHRLSLV